jgi:branched-chain amino acid transport system substrate-binding protein
MVHKRFGLFVVSVLILSMMVMSIPLTSAQEGGVIQHTECQEDLTGETIPFYTFGDLSGAYAGITQPLAAGFSDAIAYFNAQGGICGAKISLVSDDTGGDQELTQSLYDRYSTADPKPLQILLYSSADAELLREQVAEDEIPINLFAGSTAGLYGENADEPGWIFAAIPLYTSQFGAFCEWVAASWEGLGIEGDPAIGHLSWEGSFGRSTETPETTAYCESLGVSVVGGEYFLPTSTDVTAQIQTLVEEKGANILFTTSLATGPALIAADLVNLGLEEKVLLAGVNWAIDSSVGLLGMRTFAADGMPSTDGIVGLLPYVWWDEPHPGTQLVQEQFAANDRSPTLRNIAYLAGFVAIDQYIEAVIRTVNRVGYANLDGAALYETMNDFQYDALGGVLSYVFSPDVREQTKTRIGMLTYAKDADGAPVIVEVDGNPMMVPIVVPLTEEAMTTPDLRPGGADVP